MAFLPFFFFAIGRALSYVSPQAQHLRPRGVAAPGQPKRAEARRSAALAPRSEAIWLQSARPDAAESLALSLS